MKKQTIILSVLLFILLIPGCKKNPVNEKKELTIVTSFYPMYVTTLNIAKDIPGIRVINLTKPQTGCLHDYFLTIDDMQTLEQADILVVNGAGMESFLEKIISQLTNLKIIEASKDIKLVKNNSFDNDSESKDHELYYNPHVWVSITLCIEQVKNISENLSELDTKNSIKYKENAKIYIDKLEKLKIKMHDKLDNIKNKNIITFHEAFPYFAEEFNFNIVSVIEREPGSEPSSKELSDTIAIIKGKDVKALFAEPQYSGKAAETIARETGLKVFILDPVVTGNLTEDAYLNAMENNLTILEKALK